MATAIEFNNISKQYRLGLVSTRTLSHDLNRWWKINVLGKEDPYLKIGETNDRAHKGKSEYVWALRDIDFKVEQGDVLGIIGKNGAGKSTLLKILSKVTAPTEGIIKANGRIGSLLEVGTGFHPEMTGRENIFMNGSIMGMTKNEIKRKFDEIVDFAGVERYVNTPVKRYSSGMTVRLGFAIAAHLEPEILVVDEVLAVGDAEFQKKAIGKMQDVSKSEGRTVLFVSHNMSAVSRLCNKGLLLEYGSIKTSGNIKSVIDEYMDDDDNSGTSYNNDNISKPVQLNSAYIFDNTNTAKKIYSNKENLFFKAKVHCEIKNKNIRCNVGITDTQGNLLCLQRVPIYGDSSIVEFTLSLNTNVFLDGKYFISISLDIENETLFEIVEKVAMFEVIETSDHLEQNLRNSNEGVIKSIWKIEK